jgi:hypothetical protein
LNAIRNDPDRLKLIRSRLSDLSWWMRLLCQQIAVRANHEDSETGRFFSSRDKAVRLLDEAAILACAAYVDIPSQTRELFQDANSRPTASVQPSGRAFRTIDGIEHEPIASKVRDSRSRNRRFQVKSDLWRSADRRRPWHEGRTRMKSTMKSTMKSNILSDEHIVDILSSFAVSPLFFPGI